MQLVQTLEMYQYLGELVDGWSVDGWSDMAAMTVDHCENHCWLG